MLSAKVVDGIIQVKATSAADTISIARQGGTFTITIATQVTGASTTTQVTNLSAHGVHSIRVRGLGGNDTIAASGSFPNKLIIFGGDGNDTITGGGGSD
ncbi:MAG TPA: hypothetical protein VGP94_04840, partial [Tepidisphaeraceae bacterium]|nr:hypothetical protein [Tepidisphaeraceae bacterium]